MCHIKNQSEDVKHLLQLIQDNPNMPIILMVDTEVVASDEYAWWMGHWGAAEIDDFVEGHECFFLKNIHDAENIMQDFYGDECEEWPDEKFEAKYAALPWVKCIVVWITT